MVYIFFDLQAIEAKILSNSRQLSKKDIIGKLPEKTEIFAVFCGERFIEIARKVKEGQMIARPNFVFN